jgi:DME family drug/metabolite transporter
VNLPPSGAAATGSVLLGGMLFGTAGVAQAFAPSGAHPLTVGAMRLSVGAIALIIFVLARGDTFGSVVRLWGSPAGLIATAGAAAYQPFFFAGVARVGVPLGTLVAVGSAPIFTGLLGWVWRRERPTGTWALATTICVAGLALLTGAGAQVGSLDGIALTAGAGVSIACYTVAAKSLLESGVDAIGVCASTFLLGSIVVLPFALGQGIGWARTGSGVLVALYLGLATMAVANILYARGLLHLPPATAATLGLADPVTATALGVLVLGQTVSPLGWLGFLGVVVGLLLQGIWAARAGRRDQLPLG